MDETGLLRQLVQDFSRKELARPEPGSERTFETSLQRARSIGLFNSEIGAQGVSVLCHALLEMGQVDSGLAVAVFSHWAAAQALKDAGLAHPGENLVAFAPFQSPDESSAEQGSGVKAGLNAEDTLLSGKAQSVVLAADAASAVILADTGRGVSYFSVNLGSPQVRVSLPIATLGARGCPIFDLELHEAPGTPLGERASYERMHERMALAAAAISLGVARASVEEAIRYSKVRRQGGKEIGQWTEIKILLSRMTSRLRVATLAFLESCRAADLGTFGWERDAVAVLIVSQELACELTSDGIQVLGGAGYTMEFEQEERFRTAFQIQHLLGSLCARKLRFGDR